MIAFYNLDGSLMGYVEGEGVEDGFSIEGMTKRNINQDSVPRIKQEMKNKTNLQSPKDIKPIKADVTPHPKV